jgi:hypothetical protein
MAANNFSKAEIEELRSLIKLLQKDIDGVEFDNLVKSGKAAKDYLQKLREESTKFAGDIGEAVEGFQRMINEIKNTNTGVNKVAKSFQNLSSIAEKIQYHQRGISTLTEKDIKLLQEKQKKEKVNLENISKLLQLEKKGLEDRSKANQAAINNLAFITNKTLAERIQLRGLVNERTKLNKELQKNITAQGNIVGILKEEDTYYNQLEADLASINTQLDKEQRLLGLGGVAIKGIGSALDKLGFGGLSSKLGLEEANEKMKELAKEIREANGDANSFANKFKVLKAGISSMGSSLIENLKDPLVISTFFITQIIDALKSADDQTGQLAKSFNKSYSEASKVRNELNTIANLSGDINVSTKGLQESMVAVGNSLGTNAMLNEKDLVTFTKLREMAGYTNEELIGIQQLSLVNGKTLEDNTKEILGGAQAYANQNKLVINEKEVLKEISKASASLKLSLGGSAEALAIAVVQAKQFGLNLEQAEKISHSLLQFEDSISSELEAELLTGKNFNFERARSLALEGKTAEAAAEVAKQVGSAKDFGKLNVIQQEAIAKSMGMQRNELAQSLMDKEALAKLSAKEGESAQQAFNRLVEEVGMEEAKKRLGNDQIAKQYEQQSIQEKFNATVEKLKEVFMSLVTPLMPVLDVFSEIFKIVGPIVGGLGQMLKFLVPIAKWVGIIAIGYKTMQFAGDGLYRKTVLINAAKKIGLITDRQSVMTQKAANILAKGTLLTENQKEMVKRNSLLLTIKNNIQKKLELMFGKQSLATSIKEAAIKAKNYLVDKATNVLLYTRNILSAIGNSIATVYNAIAKSSLVKLIGQAVTTVIRAFTSLGPWGLVAGLAAGASVAALGYKFLKGNDIMSAGKGKNGYGKRTLLAPEGAIALNDKDTVIAGTDLGGKGKQQTQQSSSPSINMQPMIDKLAAVESVLNQILNKSSDVYMDSTKVGTALNISSVQVQ